VARCGASYGRVEARLAAFENDDLLLHDEELGARAFGSRHGLVARGGEPAGLLVGGGGSLRNALT